MRLLFCLIIAIIASLDILPAQTAADSIDLSKFEDDIRHWNDGLGNERDYERFAANEIMAIADNMLRLQNPDGGWPKNIDWLAKLEKGIILSRLSSLEKASTCDNRNTYSQIEYLSKVYTVTGIDRYRVSAERGLEFILATQNKSGGWRGADVDAITFNDDLMAGVMNLLLDIREGRPHFLWMSHEKRKVLSLALDRAIEATLRCQISVNGKKTGWCQQHDHMSYVPVKARSYELPSIASLETSNVVEFLMRLRNPNSEIQDAVRNAVFWLERAKLSGIRVERVRPESPVSSRHKKRLDTRVVPDSSAPPTWARYYEIETNRPFFANRDGIKVYSLEEVQIERRMGYAWYGEWPESLLTTKYPQWLRRMRTPRDTSFTLYSAWEKEVKQFASIRPVVPALPESVYPIFDQVYSESGGRQECLDLFLPLAGTGKPAAAVLLVHGGGWSSGSKEMEHPMAQYLAQNGYAAITVEYRLSPEAKYPAAVDDIAAAIRWLKKSAKQFNIDTQRIALYGTSAGGQLATLVGTRFVPPVQAIVDVDGVLDMTHPAESGKDTIPGRPSAGMKWLGFSFRERPELWREASPLRHVSSDTPPVLFVNSSIERFHAGRDEMRSKMKEHGVYSEVHTIPNTPHPFWLFDQWFDETAKTTVRFLDRILGKNKQ